MATEEDRRKTIGRRKVDLAWRALAMTTPILMVIVIVVAIVEQNAIHRVEINTKRIDRSQHLLYTTALRECQRLQGLRAEVNRLSKITYRVLTAAAERTPDPSISSIYKKFANETRYLPATNCKEAASNPKYNRPPAQLLSERLGKKDK